jgi:hypothetical protein
MATSPSDATNRNILAWLDRLQASVRAGSGDAAANFASSASASLSGAKKAPNFKSASFNSTNPNFASNPAFEESPDEDEMGNEGEGEDEEDDDESTALPDASVPLGLIANLSLSNNRSRERRGGRNGEAATREDELDELDDDNVVRTFSFLLVIYDRSNERQGVANAAYFMPGPATDLGMRAQLIEQHSPPEILIHGLVVPEDVDKLFEMCVPFCPPTVTLLTRIQILYACQRQFFFSAIKVCTDCIYYSPSLLCLTQCYTPRRRRSRDVHSCLQSVGCVDSPKRSDQALTLSFPVCAISSRYYPEKSEIYPIAMHFAKHSAANALIDGWKSVELCQAYILMSIYAVPARKWEEDRSWLYTGLAIRLATDLNLHQVQNSKAAKGNEKQEREILNRTRVWMICFNLDRSTATQFGKPSTIKED